MLEKHYYCLIAGLPDLFFNGSMQDVDRIAFKKELINQLSDNDLQLLELLCLQYDNYNLLNLIFKKEAPLNLLGNYSQEFLEMQIDSPKEVPEYMIRFINQVKSAESKDLDLATENKLYRLYYKSALSVKNIFLNEWFNFELTIKNLIAASNCKQYGYNIEDHLINAGSELVYSLLVNKRFDFEFYEDDLPFAEQLFRISKTDQPSEEKEKAIDRIIWNYLDDATFFHYFTIERVLGYFIKLGIIERWMNLDMEAGQAFLNKLLEELKLSYTFQPEFNISN